MRIDTQYNTGSRIYYMSNNKIESSSVQSIYIKFSSGKPAITYVLHNGLNISENLLFVTKDDLILSLIDSL